MPNTHVPSVAKSARLFWRSFLAIWVFPAFFFVGWQVVQHAIGLAPYFWVVAVLLLLVGLGRPALLYFTRRLSYLSVVVWAMLVPFIIWGVVLVAHQFLLRASGVSSAA